MITTNLWRASYIPTDRQTSWGVLHHPCTVPVYTVGAKSITRFLKKYVLLRQNISGHRHGRELWFFLFERSLPGKSYRGEDS
jgi:hypothetical protein